MLRTSIAARSPGPLALGSPPMRQEVGADRRHRAMATAQPAAVATTIPYAHLLVLAVLGVAAWAVVITVVVVLIDTAGLWLA